MPGRSRERASARTGRTGRRPGESGTRAAILEAARRSFAAKGYEVTSIRGIARDAGVDPALVHHYFGTKDEVFVEALRLPVNPAAVARDLIAEGSDGVGERAVSSFLSVWGGDATREPFVALLRSALTNEPAAELLRGFVQGVLRRVAEELGMPDVELRASLTASQIVGLGLLRYVVRVEPLASIDEDTLIAWVAPTIQRYLAGDLERRG